VERRHGGTDSSGNSELIDGFFSPASCVFRKTAGPYSIATHIIDGRACSSPADSFSIACACFSPETGNFDLKACSPRYGNHDTSSIE
jgi:hypothetical protein